MAFRFIHTADLHLDAPLKALALRDPDLAAQVGVASRVAFSRLIDICIEREVAFLVIAGDLWDGEYSSTKTPRFLKQELLRLESAGIGCFIIRGNHDALARQTGELELPANTHLFGGRAATVDLQVNGHPIAIHGLSFRDAHAPESLLPRYPAARAGAFNIGLMHTSLNGSSGHDLYAPCSLADLEAQGYDYWALGHIHKRSVFSGRSTVVMPGIPQGRDIGEAGPKSVTIVEVSDQGIVTLEEITVACLRFDRVEIDCTGLSDWQILLDRLGASLREIGTLPRVEEHLVIRPMFMGQTALSWRMLRDRDRLGEEAAAFAAGLGVWIDKVELRVTGEAAEVSQLPAELVETVLRDLLEDPALAEAISAAAHEFLKDLPPELRDILGADEAEFAARCRALLAEGAPRLLGALRLEERS